jgi:NAD(P)-dependent dehydrogenase (short-subunit alcohol dehydrogenase family)
MKKIMLVTGAGRGIGARIAVQAAAEGYAVCVNFLKNEAAAQQVVDEIKRAGGEAVARRADVGDQQQARALFEWIDGELGTIDVLVNNAGILVSQPVEDTQADGLLEVFRANVFSTFYCCGEAVRRMSTAHGGKGGVIVNLSSAAARHGGLPLGTQYCASKGAIDSLTVALAKEVGTSGIRVNALRPGVIATEIHNVYGGMTAVEKFGATVPLGRAGQPDEVAAAVLWLASPAASYVHGAVIDVSGGR